MKSYFPYIICFSLSILLVVLYARNPIVNNFQNTPSAMESFLLLDCAVDSPEKELIAAMRSQAEKAEAYFIDIVENGIPKEAIAAAQKDFAAFYPSYLEFIKDDRREITIERPGEEAKAWQPAELSQDAFVKRKVKAFILRYKVRALEGLATLRTDSAKEYLLKKAGDNKFELAPYAKQLLED